MARELYAYWKLPPAVAAEAATAVATLQAQLMQRHAHLQARLLRRAEAARESITWMEIYSAPPDGIGPELQAAIDAAVNALLAPFGAGPRHVEVFEAAPR